MTKPIILASQSPRRRELLNQIGLTFTTAPADVDERMLEHEPAEEYAVRLSHEKAHTAAVRGNSGIVIAADTIVVVDNVVLGKPLDARDAERMLRLLSGRDHEVITGVSVLDIETGKERSANSVTRVWFRDLTAVEISGYVASGEPLDKAGAYGIQEKGALLVRKIEGCYSNVVGLPLSLLVELLKEFGISILK